MRGLQIVCSPNRSTQEWPPTWCTKGSSITPFPGYGVPSACMRASRAGLILTPHRITELGGPTSVRRREARPLGWLPILELVSLLVHTGARAVACSHAAVKNKGLDRKDRSSDEIPYILSFPRPRKNYTTPALDGTLSGHVCVIKKHLNGLTRISFLLFSFLMTAL